ncbi:hypothetical protein ACWC5I_07555 [Kitasatospora sp. NPDC001574]
MPVLPPLTRLDSRVEAALGASIAVLRTEPARLDAASARVLDAHHVLTRAEITAAFERVRLTICADRQRRVDGPLLADLSTQLEALENAAAARDRAEADLLERLQALQHRNDAGAVTVAAEPAGPRRNR